MMWGTTTHTIYWGTWNKYICIHVQVNVFQINKFNGFTYPAKGFCAVKYTLNTI